MTSRYTQWCVTFNDSKEQNTSRFDSEGKILVEADLRGAFYQLNL